MKTKSKSILCGAALGVLALTQVPFANPAPLAAPAAPSLRVELPEEGAALKAALGAITENNLSADLHFIASDEMAGRDTPSPGQRMAARFIRARLMRLGFTPAGDPDSYLYTYQLKRAGLDVDNTSITLQHGDESESWEFGKDYYFANRGDVLDSKVTGGVVFAGAGTAENLGGLDLSGKWALVIGDEMSLGNVVENARQNGALGVLVASEPGGKDAHSPKRAARMARFMGRRGLRVVEPAAGDFFPSIYISAEALESLTFGDVPEVGTDLEATLTDLRSLQAGSEPFDVENVAGLWPGSDPKLAKEVLIISAHYDHIGQDEEGIFNGADDNGSGTCGLLSIAEALKAYGPMKRSVLLLWVSGEEKGLLGSQAWTKNPSLPEGLTAVCDLNIDMIGRNAPDYLLITPTSEHEAYNGLTRMAEKYGPMEGFPKLGRADEYWSRSDHANFSQNMHIPVAFLFPDIHADYHKRTDTVEKIDFNKIKRISSMVVRMLDELQGMDLSQL